MVRVSKGAGSKAGYSIESYDSPRESSVDLIPVICGSLHASYRPSSLDPPYRRSILDACGTLSGPNAPQQGEKLAQMFAEACAVGMQDNWSQVRYAASVANRSLMQALSPEDREPFYPRLLPRMCLNR